MDLKEAIKMAIQAFAELEKVAGSETAALIAYKVRYDAPEHQMWEFRRALATSA